MNYIRVTKENIDKEHICCAMSGKQSLAKKEWMKQRFDEGLVFYRSEERGKCFIEYIPAENAWVPIEADDWFYINCLWVSGSMKGHGYSNDLLEECIRNAKMQGRKGICILCAEGRKREFLADPKFLNYKGFKVADISDCGINLMYLPVEKDAQPPKFRECLSILRLRKLVLSSITPTSVRIPIIGCQGCSKWQRNMALCLRSFILWTKKVLRMSLHQSLRMLYSKMVNF